MLLSAVDVARKGCGRRCIFLFLVLLLSELSTDSVSRQSTPTSLPPLDSAPNPTSTAMPTTVSRSVEARSSSRKGVLSRLSTSLPQLLNLVTFAQRLDHHHSTHFAQHPWIRQRVRLFRPCISSRISSLTHLSPLPVSHSLLYLYANDTLALSHTGLTWRTSEDVTLTSVFFSSFFGCVFALPSLPCSC